MTMQAACRGEMDGESLLSENPYNLNTNPVYFPSTIKNDARKRDADKKRFSIQRLLFQLIAG